MNNEHPSNRLYHGELNGDPVGGLQTVIAELYYEAGVQESLMLGVPPDEADLKFAEELRQTAENVGKVLKFVRDSLEEFYVSLAKEVREKQMGGTWSEGIADALEDGDWSRLAI